MTAPTRAALKADWLSRYLVVERQYDKYLYKTLKKAAEDTEERLAALEGRAGRGAVTRRYQMRIARETMDELFGTNLTGTIREYQGDAAVAATDALLYDERGLLTRVFTDAGKRREYAESMRLTAQRNVEAAITRVYHTEIPLSDQVWKTEALSKGLVDTAINNALARGDSARELASTVRDMIRPDVPGGVSYAARRLGRTEINNAFHAQSIMEVQDTPWITHMEWKLSATHIVRRCWCEEFSVIRLFEKEQVPEKPHPNCRCYVVPVVPDTDVFDANFLMGHYDQYLEEWL